MYHQYEIHLIHPSIRFSLDCPHLLAAVLQSTSSCDAATRHSHRSSHFATHTTRASIRPDHPQLNNTTSRPLFALRLIRLHLLQVTHPTRPFYAGLASRTRIAYPCLASAKAPHESQSGVVLASRPARARWRGKPLAQHRYRGAASRGAFGFRFPMCSFRKMVVFRIVMSVRAGLGRFGTARGRLTIIAIWKESLIILIL